MSTTVHQAIILPKGKLNVYCKDGLSAIDVLNIQHIYHFGGNFNFINCGADNEYAGLFQAKSDMNTMMLHKKAGSQAYRDFKTAVLLNSGDIKNFAQTDVYKTWFDQVGKKGLFEVLYKHWCGKSYSGPDPHMVYLENGFKTRFCRDKLTSEN